MSVEVRIKQKSLFRKKLDIKDIIKITGLSYGVSDEYGRLIKNEMSKHTFIYDENKLARGIDLYADGPYIQLILSMPTSLSEIKTFYQAISSICNELNVSSYEKDGVKVKLSENQDYIKLVKDASLNFLIDLLKDESEDKSKIVTIFGIYNKIYLGAKEAQEIDNNLDNFENLLNRIQSIDADYLVPKFYKQKDRILGVYNIEENISSIIPTNPTKIYDGLDKLNDWYINFPNGNDEENLLKYEDFIKNVNNRLYYDAKNCIVRLNKDEIKAMLEKYSTSL